MRTLIMITLCVTPLLWANAEKPLIVNESGFIVCTGGGTQQPLFSKDCKTLNLSRILSGGGVKYEGTCVDSNGILYFLACDAINFEYQKDPNAGKLGSNPGTPR